MTPHKHAEAIRAWADGAIIEVNCGANDIWSIVDRPSWALENNYRVAVPLKPDQILYFNIGRFGAVKIEYWQRELCAPNIAATFDGETHKLKSVEVLK
jgi:hypothetical protein